MKTKLIAVALLASAALITPAFAGGQHGGGGGGGGNFGGGGRAAARSGGGPSFGSMPAGRFGGGPGFRSMPMQSFGRGRMIYSGQRFSSLGMRSPRSMEFRPQSIRSNAVGSIGSNQVARGNINRVNRSNQFAGNRSTTNLRRDGTGAGQVRNGNANLRSDWRNHVFAQHSANWHRDWDRHHDHFFDGHRLVFFDGFWWGFDLGFDPWWPYWYYPYDYYGYDYYPYQYGYDPGYYDSGGYQGDEYYAQSGYGNADADSTIAAAQQQLAREGYYRGQIDGILGPGTRAAIAQYQSNHGLHVTGALSSDTLQALGLRPS
jgi:hypothetical protein